MALALLGLALARPAPLRSQVFAGQAVEALTRTPIVGLPVRLRRLPDGGGPPVLVDSSRTYDRGLFQLPAPGPGVYQLEFGVARAALALGPVDTVAADAFVQRRFDIDIVRRAAERPYLEFQVQEPVRPLAAARAPQYPKELREARVEGDVLAQFVVDATGVMAPGSFKVLRSTDAAFTKAVYEAVRQMRFLPARVGGVAVPQLVQQPFQFQLGY